MFFRLLTIDARRHVTHVYDYITIMRFDSHSGTSMRKPLDPHQVYTKADEPTAPSTWTCDVVSASGKLMAPLFTLQYGRAPILPMQCPSSVVTSTTPPKTHGRRTNESPNTR